ncbi:hypothetical protein N499_0100A, partial [Wolbachia pipientis wVitA]
MRNKYQETSAQTLDNVV